MQSSIGVKTTGIPRVGAWDGWRGAAITLVLCGHFFDIPGLWEDRMGVDVFFVLSGMLMSTILFDERLSLKDFYIRRLSRVYPVLLAYVLAVSLFAWTRGFDFTLSEITASLLFIRTYYPSVPSIWSSEIATGHLWSLNVEEHAYVVLSLITLIHVSRKSIGLLLLGLGLISVTLGFYQYNTLPTDDFKLYLIRTESAIVFIFFSAGYGLLKRQANWQGNPIRTVTCLLGALVCYTEPMPLWLIFSVSPILLSIAVNHLDDLPKFLDWFFSLKPLKYLGICSYSIYIWQQFFFEYLWAFPIPNLMVGCLAVTTGIASYHCLEYPTRQFINSRWTKKPIYRLQANP